MPVTGDHPDPEHADMTARLPQRGKDVSPARDIPEGQLGRRGLKEGEEALFPRHQGFASGTIDAFQESRLGMRSHAPHDGSPADQNDQRRVRSASSVLVPTPIRSRHERCKLHSRILEVTWLPTLSLTSRFAMLSDIRISCAK